MQTEQTEPNAIKDRIADVIREIEEGSYRPTHTYGRVRLHLLDAIALIDRAEADKLARAEAEAEAEYVAKLKGENP